MPEFVKRIPVPVSVETLYRWHASGGALPRLIPPWQPIALRSWRGGEATENLPVPQQEGDISKGATVTLETRVGPLTFTVVAKHTAHVRNEHFVDEMVRGPFAKWHHAHRFLPDEAGACLEDHIQYALPGGVVGNALGGWFARRNLAQMFAFRHRRTLDDLLRHKAFADQPRMRIAISGASGLVGRALTAFLRGGGHHVHPLVRRPAREHSDEIQWSPTEGTVDIDKLNGVDAVIHLAGESINGRWSAAKKERILNSRVQGTQTLAAAIAAMEHPPKVLISTSAVGIYGDSGEHILEETHDQDGDGFLADVCRQWEAAAQPARDAGVRVVHPRVGMVVAAQGGALPRMLTPFQLGLGGPVGSGRQWMSWISLDDLIGLIHHALFTESLDGPLNAVSPNPIINREFGQTLGRVLRRPAVMPLPAAAIQLGAGQMGRELLLYSIRASSARAEASGFTFLQPTLESALRAELGR